MIFMPVNVALVGNPNCGKTTLFNILTGSRQHVGNWAGVTVDKKTGKIKNCGYNLIDLPGIYSLASFSTDEKITYDFLVSNKPDAVINVIDGTHFERNMFLTLQLAELELPVITVVNMMDEVEKSGMVIDFDLLYSLTGIRFIPISARNGDNTEKITEALKKIINQKPKYKIQYQNEVQNALNSIYNLIYDKNKYRPYTYLASRILEGDQAILDNLKLNISQKNSINEIKNRFIEKNTNDDYSFSVTDARYEYIENLSAKTIKRKKSDIKKTITYKIDRIVTGKLFAYPIFLGIMLCIFITTFGPLGTFLSELTESIITTIISPALINIMNCANAPIWTVKLVTEGLIGGVGSVLKFLPQISIFFLFLSILEDSGYMARAAFITDGFMKKIGLSGKAFIPMLMGFGCTTTAVMAARTQENQSERNMTVLLTPFMSCGAKLPVYALFAEVFFPECKGLIIFAMYLTGFLAAIPAGILFKKTIFKNSNSGFIMELPPYRLPLLSSVLKNTYEKAKGFFIKAGTLIFSISIIIWLLQNLSPDFTIAESGSDSLFASIGKTISPIFSPLGFGNWQSAVSLLSGIAAKEAIISSMGVLYSSEFSLTLTQAISQSFTPLSALTFMLFVLLYTPCISAVSAIKRETGSWKYAIGSSLFQFITAYSISFIVYQTGNFFIQGVANMSIVISIICIALVVSGIYIFIKNIMGQIKGSKCGKCSCCQFNCKSRNLKSK